MDKTDNLSPNYPRRRFLRVATTVVGGAGIGIVGIPFIGSFAPSERARAAGAPVQTRIDALAPGEMVRVAWRGKPVWVLRRTPEMLKSLSSLDGELKDAASEDAAQQPDYARNEHRSIRPEFFIAVGICTHLGCSPTFRPEVAPEDLGDSWQGGFFCPCHGSRFDLAGRVYRGAPATGNLLVPPHRFLADGSVLIGEDKA